MAERLEESVRFQFRPSLNPGSYPAPDMLDAPIGTAEGPMPSIGVAYGTSVFRGFRYRNSAMIAER